MKVFSYCKAIFHQVVNVVINTCLHDAKIFAFSGKKIVMKEKISFQQLRPFLTFPLFRSGPPSVSRVCKGNVFLFLNEIFFSKFYMAFVLKIENSFYPWFYPWTNNNRKVCKNLTTALCDVYSVPGITRRCHFESELVDWVMLPCK